MYELNEYETRAEKAESDLHQRKYLKGFLDELTKVLSIMTRLDVKDKHKQRIKPQSWQGSGLW